MTLFQIKSNLEGIGVRALTYEFLRNTIQPITAKDRSQFPNKMPNRCDLGVGWIFPQVYKGGRDMESSPRGSTRVIQKEFKNALRPQ